MKYFISALIMCSLMYFTCIWLTNTESIEQWSAFGKTLFYICCAGLVFSAGSVHEQKK